MLGLHAMQRQDFSFSARICTFANTLPSTSFSTLRSKYTVRSCLPSAPCPACFLSRRRQWTQVLPAPSLPLKLLRNWKSLTHRALEISSRTPSSQTSFMSWEKACQRTPGTIDSEKLTGCSQKPKHSAIRTQSARNTEFFDMTRRIINKIAPRQTS